MCVRARVAYTYIHTYIHTCTHTHTTRLWFRCLYVCVYIYINAHTHTYKRGRIQKFPDWPPEARTANGTVLCHKVQLYRYFVSQSNEFCSHNALCCFSARVCCCLFRYRLSPETFGYTLARARARVCLYIYIYIILFAVFQGHRFVSSPAMQLSKYLVEQNTI
jgi:hypothetical protein